MFRSPETVLRPCTEALVAGRQSCRMNVERRPIAALAGAGPLVRDILSNEENNVIGEGAFSRVHEIDDKRVLKLSRDLVALQLLERLAAQSACFAKTEHILLNQATAGDTLPLSSGSRKAFRYGCARSWTTIAASFAPAVRVSPSGGCCR